MSDLFTVRLCSEKSAFEARLSRTKKLDLSAVAELIASATGMRIRVNLPAILILENNDGQTITIFPDGRMLLRGFESQERAEEMVRAIVDRISEA